MYRIFTFLILFFLMFNLSAQDTFEGKWMGVITQNEGAYRTEYKYELYLQQKGQELIGRSFVYIDDIFAEIKVIGKLVDKDRIQFTETAIIADKKNSGMEWCIKEGELQINMTTAGIILQGTWRGSTSFSQCIPGKISLQKVTPRA